ncbi:MAG: MlaC/ttg2D family ABC transporter substrate-binding protein [Planctomycetota bacterium]|jgi:phospholipid transport system substrate-binding protein
MKNISYLLLCFILLCQVAVADVDTEAEKTLKTSVNKVFSVLSDKELSLDQKKRELNEVTNSVFGLPLMAKLSLGKKQWSKLNSKQREEFTSLTIGMFHDFYSEKISLFSDVKVDFDRPIVESEKKVQIPTSVLYNGRRFSILYKMFKAKNVWKIYDVEVEGVSLIKTYRSQYLHVLKKDKIEGLLTKLREQKKIKNYDNYLSL